jgi:Flp pilus assembly protein TadG
MTLMLLQRFLQDRRGGITPMFALAIIPVFGLIGAAVDYSRANSVRAAMQAAADSTALMLSKDASTLTASQLSTKATAYFQAMFNRPEAKSLTITPVYSTTGGSSLTITASSSVDTSFMKIMGYPQLNVGTSSTVRWGNSRLRVALVLDNTGSMNDYNKIGALKTATTNLLTQFKNAATNNGDVYVSIIPFVKDVNVDSSNYNASWIDWTDWNANNSSNSNSNSSCGNGNNGNGNNGNGNNGNNGNGNNGNGNNGNGNNGNGNGCGVTPANHNTWNGCVTDRGNSNAPSSGNYDTNVVAPTSSIPATLFSAEQYGSCPQAVMPLSYNWTAMTTQVTNMVAAGNTNQAIGLAHGWMSLVGGGPYPAPPTMDPNYTYQQVIILLTDGLNTQDRWYTNQSSIDARQQLTCNNIKAAGITLYTIQVNTDGDPTSTLLQNCATDSSKFFLLTSASQIVTTFNTIGTNLSKLRIAK